MECKLRCVNFRGLSDCRRAFRLAFRVTAISDDWYRTTMRVILISLRTPGRASNKSGSADNMPGIASDKTESISNHCQAVWEK